MMFGSSTSNMKEHLNSLNKENKTLFSMNVQELKKQAKYQFSRKELHDVYIMYKTLSGITSQKKQDCKGEGVDFCWSWL